MARPRLIVLILVLILWLIAMPLGFATLYSVIELQAAARAASKDDNRLSTFRTTVLAAKLEFADRHAARREALTTARNDAMIDLFETRNAVRASAIDLLSEHGIQDATGLCTASLQKQQECQVEQKLFSC